MNDGYEQPGGDLPLPPPSGASPGAPQPPGGTASYGAGSGDLAARRRCSARRW